MISFIVAIGVMNLLLGYGLAMSLADPPFLGLKLSDLNPRTFLKNLWSSLRRGYRWKKSAAALHGADETHAEQSDSASAHPADHTPALPQPLTLHDIPTTWREPLARECILPESYFEGVIEWLRVEATDYRLKLIAAEGRARQAHAQNDPQAAQQLIDDLKFINGMFLSQQQDAAERIVQGKGRLENCEEQGKRLQAILWDQSSQMEWIGQRIASLESSKDVGPTIRHLLSELTSLGCIVNHLRDSLLALLEEVLENYEQLSRLDMQRQIDPCTGLPQRIGLATRLLEGKIIPPVAEGETRYVALIELDGLHHINQRLGLFAGDCTMRALAQQLRSHLETVSPTAEMVRISGPSFLILLASASEAAANEALERLRQTMEATTFRFQGVEMLLTISIGSCLVHDQNSVESLLQLVRPSLKEAIRMGRNTLVVEGKAYKPLKTNTKLGTAGENSLMILSQTVEISDLAA